METRICKYCGNELPLENFAKNGFGYTYVCKECNSKNRKAAKKLLAEKKKQEENAVNARNIRLSDFQPRELMEELKRRGYEFEMTYVEVHKISSKTL